MPSTLQILVRKLPGLPGRQMMQFESLTGEPLFSAPLDDRIAKILNGRWSCTLLASNDGNQMEILGEAPPQNEAPTTTEPPTPKPPHTLRLTQHDD